MTFSIIEFEDGLQVVPTKWLCDDGTRCKWPSYVNPNKVIKSVTSLEEPKEDWHVHQVIRNFGAADSYEKAIQKMRGCERFSDVESDNDIMSKRKKRQTRAKKILESSSSETDFDESQSLLSHFPAAPHFTKPLATSTQLSCKEKPQGKKIAVATMQVQSSDVLPLENSVTVPTQELRAVSGTSLSGTENQIDKEFHKLILRKLNHLIYKVDSLEEKLMSLGDRNKVVVTDEEVCIQKLFPLKTFEEVDHCESLLKDATFCDKLILSLKVIGGNHLQGSVTNLLKRMLTNQLATEYSWLGAKGKKNFRKLELSHVVMRVVRFHYPSATETEVSIIISNWLKHAKKRCS
ncbi:uncharacterized protein LOC134529655 [Bacillus rossius redtenbacheri]|uniref:uncharacterized protein LOC134529655 n=1 Tax=Bacillus rossius redtenbacheri TaxID=93214 RepID=UPI002FDD5E04